MFDGKFLTNDTVAGTKIRLANTQYLKARNAANSADVNILRLNASNVIEFASRPEVLGLGQLALISEITGATFSKDTFNVTAPIGVNTGVSLANAPLDNSVFAFITTGPTLVEGVDYTVSGSTLTLLAASPVIALLDNGDVVKIGYAY